MYLIGVSQAHGVLGRTTEARRAMSSNDVDVLLDYADVIAIDLRRVAAMKAEEGLFSLAAATLDAAAAAARIVADRHEGFPLGRQYAAHAAQCEAEARAYRDRAAAASWPVA